MAISGSTDFSLNRDEVIDKALELIGVKEATITPSTAEVTQAAQWLNIMLKEWQTTTHNSLWVRKTGTVFLEKGKVSYNLGTGSYAATGTVIETTTDADVASGATLVPVASTTGMANSDNVLIIQDDGTMAVAVISSFVAGVSITLNTFTTDTIASGSKVYVFTNKAHRPQKIMEAALRDSSNNDRELTSMSQREYMQLSSKTQSSTPSQYYLDMQLGDAVLYPWPLQDSNDTQIVYKYIKHYDDMDAASDDLEFPVEWTMAIIYGLALHLGNVYGVEEELYNRLQQVASRTFKNANKYDIEDSSMEIQPDMSEM